jgi:hypothetical protein
MASVKTDNGPGGMRNNFEAAAAHLLPYDPVVKKRAGTKRMIGHISASEVGPDVAAVSASGGGGQKPSSGNTGIHYR